MDLKVLSQEPGVVLKGQDFGDVCSASLVQEWDISYIGVNTQDPIQRRRMAVAYIIGRIVLHKAKFDFIGKCQNLTDIDQLTHDSSEAISFATELLQPTCNDERV